MSIFKGTRTGNGIRVTVDNIPLNFRLDLINYAPNGFDWGYDGLGSAQLALAILAQELGDGSALNFHEEFQRQVVNCFNHNEWTLDSNRIDSHISDIKSSSKNTETDNALIPLNLIMLEPSFDAAEQLFSVLTANGYQGQPEIVSAISEFNRCLNEQLWDIVLLNPATETNALSTVVKTLARKAIDIPVIVVLDQPEHCSVVEAMRLGAKDMVLKSNEQHLLLVLQRELDSLEARRERDRLLSMSRQVENQARPVRITARKASSQPAMTTEIATGKSAIVAGTSRSHTVSDVSFQQNMPVSGKHAPSSTDKKIVHIQAHIANQREVDKNKTDTKAILTALAANRLTLAFQPIINFGEDADRIFEIFPQLTTADGNMVTSNAMYSAMPDNMAKRIDAKVIERAAKLIVERQIAGEDIHFFIRLSNHAVVNPDLLHQIEQLIFNNALDPQRLTFAFPEQMAADNLNQIKQLIDSLEQLGCTSALYDFGESAAATQLLEKLEVRYVKLIGDLATLVISKPNETERAVKTLQRSANIKSIIMIASEVNDAQTLSNFWKYGIDYIQGDHIQAPQSKPNYEFG